MWSIYDQSVKTHIMQMVVSANYLILLSVLIKFSNMYFFLFNIETPGDQIVRKLTFERIEELKKSIRNDQLTYK